MVYKYFDKRSSGGGTESIIIQTSFPKTRKLAKKQTKKQKNKQTNKQKNKNQVLENVKNGNYTHLLKI